MKLYPAWCWQCILPLFLILTCIEKCSAGDSALPAGLGVGKTVFKPDLSKLDVMSLRAEGYALGSEAADTTFSVANGLLWITSKQSNPVFSFPKVGSQDLILQFRIINLIPNHRFIIDLPSGAELEFSNQYKEVGVFSADRGGYPGFKTAGAPAPLATNGNYLDMLGNPNGDDITVAIKGNDLGLWINGTLALKAKDLHFASGHAFSFGTGYGAHVGISNLAVMETSHLDTSTDSAQTLLINSSDDTAGKHKTIKYGLSPTNWQDNGAWMNSVTKIDQISDSDGNLAAIFACHVKAQLYCPMPPLNKGTTYDISFQYKCDSQMSNSKLEPREIQPPYTSLGSMAISPSNTWHPGSLTIKPTSNVDDYALFLSADGTGAISIQNITVTGNSN